MAKQKADAGASPDGDRVEAAVATEVSTTVVYETTVKGKAVQVRRDDVGRHWIHGLGKEPVRAASLELAREILQAAPR